MGAQSLMAHQLFCDAMNWIVPPMTFPANPNPNAIQHQNFALRLDSAAPT
jgi:hypothetical protein